MNNTEILQQFAREINKDWSSEYSAIVQDAELRVKYNHLVIALVDKRFDIEMLESGHEDTEQQLAYMISR